MKPTGHCPVCGKGVLPPNKKTPPPMAPMAGFLLVSQPTQNSRACQKPAVFPWFLQVFWKDPDFWKEWNWKVALENGTPPIPHPQPPPLPGAARVSPALHQKLKNCLVSTACSPVKGSLTPQHFHLLSKHPRRKNTYIYIYIYVHTSYIYIYRHIITLHYIMLCYVII